VYKNIKILFRLIIFGVLNYVSAQVIYNTPYNFSTISGTPLLQGSTNGAASNALFSAPGGIAVDPVGNVYIADTGNSVIRKISNSGVVTTFAGVVGSVGCVDGVSTSATFYYPSALALDTSGNVYVADTGNNIIRKITPAGVVSTLAGTQYANGLIGSINYNGKFADGLGALARFNGPCGITVDSSGNVYVADTGNNVIRKITPQGLVSTLAGSALLGVSTSIDGIGSSATFNGPFGIALDSAGNVYVSEAGYEGFSIASVLRKISPQGVVTTIAGHAGLAGAIDGPAATARFNAPCGISIDSTGNLYIADRDNSLIRILSVNGVVSTLGGSTLGSGSIDGTGASSRFQTPAGIAVDSSGRVFVVDTNNNTVRKGILSTSGVPSAPTNVSVTPGDSNAVVSFLIPVSNGGSSIIGYTITATPVAGGKSVTASGVSSPVTVTGLTNGIAYTFTATATNSNGSSIASLTSSAVTPVANIVITTQPVSQNVSLGSSATFSVSANGASLSYQWTFNGNAISGAIYSSYTVLNTNYINSGTYACIVSSVSGVSVTSSNASLSIYIPYSLRTIAGSAYTMGSANGTGSTASFLSPQALVVDSSGNVYVADTGNCIIRKITAQGVVTTFAGTSGVTGTTDGPGSIALFNYPCGIAIDNTGNLYVADTYNCTIRKITPTGIVSTIAGQAPTSDIPSPINAGFKDATGTSAKFNFPRGLACDGAGNVYVADTINCVIRKITPAGLVTTIAGSVTNTPQSLDGTGTAARFNYPYSLASDTNGNLWVADTSGQTIRAISPGGVVTTLCGLAGSAGSVGGVGNNSRFNQPASIAVDISGNLYIADQVNSTIRVVTNGNCVCTIAGLAGNVGQTDGLGSNARLYNPFGVAVDAVGNVYVADTQGETIRVASAQAPEPPINLSAIAGNGSAVISFSTPVNTGVSSITNYQVTAVSNSNGSVITVNGTGSPIVVPGLTNGLNYTFSISAQNSSGYGLSSSLLTLQLPTSKPIFTVQPQSQNVQTGSNVVFSAVVSGGALSYQWYLNGTPIAGATSSSYTILNSQSTATGTYSLVATNALGTTTSSSAVLNVLPLAPVIVSQPLGQTITPGSSYTLSATGYGVSLAYQWYLNGIPISGATSASYTIVSATAASAGAYTVAISNGGGSIISNPALVAVSSPGRLINLSVLSMDGVGSQLLTIGFVTGGKGTVGSQNLLIRGSGPALASYSIANYLADPTLNVLNSSSVSVASNDNWGSTADNLNSVNNADAATGAFAFASPNSLDAALVTSLTPAAYTVQVSGKNGASGYALAEVYDNTVSGLYTIKTPRLINISCLEQISSGASLTAGFVIGGSTSVQVLIRAVGPSLVSYGVNGVIPDPKLTVFNSLSLVLASNSGWGGDTAITAANIASGAFQFSSSNSKDSAVLLTLQPGAYTVQAASASGVSGVTLIEVYEVPTN